MRRKPFSVVLFDEIEKAHPDVFNTLLQILEDGRLTDAQGRSVDFKNTVIIMTSNLGTADLRKAAIGFARADEAVTYERMKEKVNEELKRHFRPEFLNRIDEVIVFHELSQDEVTEIVDLMMKRVVAQLESQGINLELTPAAKELLARKGYDPTLGARPLRRAIQRLVEDPLSERILWKEFRAGETVVVDVEDDDIAFRSIEGVEPPPSNSPEAAPRDSSHLSVPQYLKESPAVLPGLRPDGQPGSSRWETTADRLNRGAAPRVSVRAGFARGRSVRCCADGSWRCWCWRSRRWGCRSPRRRAARGRQAATSSS